MKTPIVIALSIIGVLGTAGAAMAVNAGALVGFQQENLGNAPTTLIGPSSTPTPTPTGTVTPEPSETAEPGDDHSQVGGTHETEGTEDHSSPSPSPTQHHEESDDSRSGSGGGSDDAGHGSDD